MSTATYSESNGKAAKVSPELLDRLPPQDLQAERGVLGSLILQPALCGEISLLIDAEDFYASQNSLIFQHLVAMSEAGKSPDSVLLHDRLKQAGDLETVGGVAYLGEVINAVPTAANAEHYARIVKAKSVLRGLINTGMEMVREAYEHAADAGQILAAAEQSILAATDAASTVRAVPFATAATKALEEMESQNDQPPGIETGFPTLDRMTGGLRPATLWFISARTGTGKTVVGSSIAEQVAFVHGKPTLFVSLEMSNSEVAERTLSRHAKVNASRVRDRQLTATDRSSLVESVAKIGDAPLWLCDAPSCSISDISGLARRHKRQHGLSLLVIDYLQFIAADNSRDTRQEQVATICRRLKGLAREIRIPVVCLAQLNREAEKGDGRPKLSHLRESGSIEQDADVVLLLQRHDDDSDRRGTATMIVAKARNGETGDITLIWQPWIVNYIEAEPETKSIAWPGYEAQGEDF